jgi:hypothetical protein
MWITTPVNSSCSGRAREGIEPTYISIYTINVSPPEGEGPKLNMTRAEVIRKLFPDIEDYVKGERLRWPLTVNHWDEDFIELDVTKEPLPVYYSARHTGVTEASCFSLNPAVKLLPAVRRI